MLAARADLSAEELIGRLFEDARVGALVVDTGYPDPTTRAHHRADSAEAAGCTAGLPAPAGAGPAGPRGPAHAVRRAAGRRTGPAVGQSRQGLRRLQVRRGLPHRPRHRAVAARRRRGGLHRGTGRGAVATGAVRLGHKPLLDTLLHVAFEVAAAAGAAGAVPRRLRRPRRRPARGEPAAAARGPGGTGLPRHAGRAAARLLAVRARGRLPGGGLRQRPPGPVLRHPVPLPSGDARSDAGRTGRRARSAS